MSRVLIVSASVGAGHDGAATELARRLTVRGHTCTVVDFLDLLPGSLGRALRRSYALQLRTAPDSWGWLYRRLEHPGGLQGIGFAVGRWAARPLAAAGGRDIAAVVCTYPLAAHAAGWLRATGRLGAPVVTYLTDMSVHPLWVAPGVDLHLAWHAIPAGQARALGAQRVALTAPAVGPAFAPAQRAATRARFGLPGGPLALVVAGSWGVGTIAAAAAEISRTGIALPVVACGHNVELRRRIARDGHGVAIGWTDAMAELIAACDVVVQNAGGLTSLETLAVGTPLVSHRCVPGHGLANSVALDQAGLAPLVSCPAELGPALAQAIAGGSRAATATAALFAGRDPAAMLAALAAPPATARVRMQNPPRDPVHQP